MKKNYFSLALKILFATGLIGMLLSCSWKEKKEMTYFGGKIKNPRSEYVVLTKNNEVLDSARLDDHNKFHFEIDSLNAGLYRFKHGPEYQYLFLQPTDSLLIYLNTWDFDESLIYSGKGSARNNFLISLFLNWERTENEFEQYFVLSEEEFNEKVEQGIAAGMKAYEDKVAAREEVSPIYEKIAKAGICSPYYILKESYAIQHKKRLGLSEWPEVSDGFYDFRNEIDINDEVLADYATFVYYIESFIYYSTVEDKYTDPEFENFYLRLMENTDEWLNEEHLRNHFFAKFAYGTLNKEDMDEDHLNQVIAFFNEHSTDERMKTELALSLEHKSKIKKGDAFPKISVIDTKGEQMSVDSLIKGSSSVVFFWPNDLMHAESVRIQLQEFEKKYPNILFVGINRMKEQEKWIKFLESNNIPMENQFRLEETEECYSWFEGDMSRTIVVNQNNKVLYSYLEFSKINPDYYFSDF